MSISVEGKGSKTKRVERPKGPAAPAEENKATPRRWCSTCKEKVAPVSTPATGAASVKSDFELSCSACETHLGWVPNAAHRAPTAQGNPQSPVIPLDTSVSNFERICAADEFMDLINDDAMLKRILGAFRERGIAAVKGWEIKALCKAFGPACPCGKGGPMHSRCKSGSGNYFWCCRRGPEACDIKIWQQSRASA